MCVRLTLDLGGAGDTWGRVNERKNRCLTELVRNQKAEGSKETHFGIHKMSLWGFIFFNFLWGLLTIVRKKWTTAFSAPRLRGEVAEAFWGAGERAPRKDPWKGEEKGKERRKRKERKGNAGYLVTYSSGSFWIFPHVEPSQNILGEPNDWMLTSVCVCSGFVLLCSTCLQIKKQKGQNNLLPGQQWRWLMGDGSCSKLLI